MISSRAPRRRAVRAALLALSAAVMPFAAAAAQTGSGTVSFRFTSFSGPFAVALQTDAMTPANWAITGLVDDAVPTAAGWADNGRGPDGLGYVTGASTLAGTSNEVRFRYGTVPSGTLGENIISFTPRPFTNVAVGEDFILGTLLFQNGAWTGAGRSVDRETPSDFGFTITTTSADGAAFNQTLDGNLRLAVHVPIGNDLTTLAGMEAEADWVYFSAGPSIGAMGAFRVFDQPYFPPGSSNIGMVDIVARFNSLDLVGFTNARGGGFVTSSIGALPPSVAVAAPEPATWMLLGGGLVAMGAFARRRRA